MHHAPEPDACRFSSTLAPSNAPIDFQEVPIMRKHIPIAMAHHDAPMHFAPQAIEHASRQPPLTDCEKAAIAALLLVLLAALAFCIAVIEGHAQIRGF